MKYSQRELCSESFWDGFKPKNWGKVAKGAVRMGADALRMVAPEITDPLDSLDQARWGLKNSFEQGYAGIPDPRQIKSDAKQKITNTVAKSIYDNISIGLARQNFKLVPTYGIKEHGVDPKNGNKLYMLRVTTPTSKNGEWIVVDGKGNKK